MNINKCTILHVAPKNLAEALSKGNGSALMAGY